MKNIMILLGLWGSATLAVAQKAQKNPQLSQRGEGNVIAMTYNTKEGDTLASHTRIVQQKGTNQIHIEASTSPDSLGTLMENVAVEQKGKSNRVLINSEGGKGNTVQISQSGSGNSVVIKQN